ncbi:CBS domain-containing protein CBSX3, mitochondrial [Hondaea fermentalgiana]|uniref:CBS domain-containing protein CBSX3, mitochondrial n=1 Tax=Hondaea fermentalgiana TaxID=2315210 RepID=A0A2R5GMT1_9STRA|nr:CBS domain-containing protein CBSX3, mitochondrial [Hondaea fermentalgiana]|eukprot:GBG32200.1 CBS domain-containing protein CBSX3, mitochondrial [Hondaea fermentalgiana]
MIRAAGGALRRAGAAATAGSQQTQRRALTSTGAAEAAPQTVTLMDILDKSKPVVSVDKGMSVRDAVGAMASNKASTIFVQDDGFVCGVIRETDIVTHAGETQGDLSTRVSDIMRPEISFASVSNTIRESLQLLNASKQDHLPILQRRDANASDDDVKVADVRMLDVTSIISAKQIIGQFYFDAVGPHAELDEKQRLNLEQEAQTLYKLPSVKSIIKAKKERSEAKGELGTMVLNTLVEDEISVAETIRQMIKYNKGSVAVMDICRDVPVLVGLATEQDIVRRVLAEGRDAEETLVADIMTRSNLATVSSKETLLACAYKMIQMNVRHLPVVSPKGEHVLAMVSSGDVVAYLCESFNAENTAAPTSSSSSSSTPSS